MVQVFLALLTFLLFSYNNNTGTHPGLNTTLTTININPYKQIKAIPLPYGFERIKDDSGSFTNFLRNIKLKENTTVYLFNGQLKHNQFAQKQFEQIVFYDNEHTAYKFSAPFTRERFDKYLSWVFGMCGSASLSKQLKVVNSFSQIQPGTLLSFLRLSAIGGGGALIISPSVKLLGGLP